MQDPSGQEPNENTSGPLSHPADTPLHRGRKVALIGGIIGLVVALGLGSLRFINSEPPEMRAQIFGNVVFPLVYATPYLIAIALSRLRHAGTRGALLLPVALLSFVASFSTFSSVTILLLPATVLLFVGALRSLLGSGQRFLRTLGNLVLGMAGVAFVVVSFLALLVFSPDESRCWNLVTQPGGQEEWQAVQSQGTGNSLKVSAGPQVSRGMCTSDIITNQEAGTSLGLLLASAAIFAWPVIVSEASRTARG